MTERDSFMVPLDLEDRCGEIPLMMVNVGGREFLGVAYGKDEMIPGKLG